MKNLKEKNTDELHKELGERQEALRVFRFGVTGTKVRNVKEGKNIRKTIAQIKTILNKK